MSARRLTSASVSYSLPRDEVAERLRAEYARVSAELARRSRLALAAALAEYYQATEGLPRGQSFVRNSPGASRPGALVPISQPCAAIAQVSRRAFAASLSTAAPAARPSSTVDAEWRRLAEVN